MIPTVDDLPYIFPDPVHCRPRKARNVRTMTQDEVVFQVLLRGARDVDRELVVCFHKPDPLGTFWLMKGHIYPHTHLLFSWGQYPTLEALRGKRLWLRDQFLKYWVAPQWEAAFTAQILRTTAPAGPVPESDAPARTGQA